MLDAALEELILEFLVDHSVSRDLMNGPNKPFSGFSNRINGAFALGLITAADKTALHMIRDIRNEAAHHIHFALGESRCIPRLEAAYRVTEAQVDGDDFRAKLLHVSMWALSGIGLSRQTIGNAKRQVPNTFMMQ